MANKIPQEIKPKHYSDWLNDASTKRLLALETEWLKSWLKQLYGCHLSYSGIDPSPRFLNYSRTQHQFRLGLPWAYQVTNCDARIEEAAWPLPSESTDVIVLQHALDLSTQPQKLIKEASRCLVPNGYLLVVGFNPYSLWGGGRLLNTFSSKLPWLSRPVSIKRLQDWLSLVDLKVEQVFNCAHTWPLLLGSSELTQRVDNVLAGTAWLPASVYLLVARKTVAGLTPIRMQRRHSIKESFGIPVAASSMQQTIDMRNKE